MQLCCPQNSKVTVPHAEYSLHISEPNNICSNKVCTGDMLSYSYTHTALGLHLIEMPFYLQNKFFLLISYLYVSKIPASIRDVKIELEDEHLNRNAKILENR